MIRILRSAFVPGLIMLVISAGFLFAIKYKVQILRRELKTINSSILTERENIHVLGAEISYLTNPRRIKSLTDEKLNLRTPKRDQIISVKNLRDELIKNSIPAPVTPQVSEVTEQ